MATVAPAATPSIREGTDQAVSVLKAAATKNSGRPAQICTALVALEKAKLPADDFLEELGGRGKEGGKTWKLVFTASSKQVTEASKGGKGGGTFFPVTACQTWDTQAMTIENGIYLGQIAALAFKGPFEWAGRKLGFNFETISLRVGPKWWRFQLKPGQFGAKTSDGDKRGPFFLFAYVDSDIVVARGREGGFGLWSRVSPEYLVSSGVEL